MQTRSRSISLVFLMVTAAAFFSPTFLSSPKALGQSAGQSVCKITVVGDYRHIDANGLPDHSTGQFPNRGNPNAISAQNYHFKVLVKPIPGEGISNGYTFGVAINGVPFDPGTAELWNGDRRWHYEALTGMLGGRGGLGVDENFAHVQPNGAYHYHGLPMGLLRRLNYQSKMTLVGYAADGYPIYGPYCYSVSTDNRSGLKMMKSSYRLRSGTRPSGNDGPGGAYDGSFKTDYEFVKGLGDLDSYNGRTGVTPEYPNGTFYYVLTDTWPFIPRIFRGEPDSSFSKFGNGGPPGGGQGQRGGFNGGPPGGFNGQGPPGGFNGGPPGGFNGGPPGGFNGQGPPGGFNGQGPPGGFNGQGPPGGFGRQGPPGGLNGQGPPGGLNGE